MAEERDEWEIESEIDKKARHADWDALLALKDDDKSSKEQARSLIPAMLQMEKYILRKKAEIPAGDGQPAQQAKADLEELRQIRHPVASRLDTLVVAHKCGWDTVKIMEGNAKTGKNKKVQVAYDEAKKNRVAAKAEKAKASKKTASGRSGPYNKGRSGSNNNGNGNSDAPPAEQPPVAEPTVEVPPVLVPKLERDASAGAFGFTPAD